MIHKDLRFTLSLLGRVVLGQTMPPADGVDWETVYRLCKSQQVDNLLAYGVLQGGYSIPAHLQETLLRSMAAFARYDARQSVRFAELCDALEAAEADYMPLKGTELKTLYPYPDMRWMVDMDVLVRQSQYPAIRKSLLRAGFRFEQESNHEYIFIKDGMHVELHKYLIPTYNDDLHAYYGDGWQLAEKTGAYRYKLGAEDSFVYVLTHFAKHYRDAGTGLRPLLDLWLCIQKTAPKMDYVRAELEKLHLSVFFGHVRALLSAWFEDGAWNPTIEEMTRFIFASGSMGTAAQSAIASAIRRENEKPESKIRRLFPKAEKLYQPYPILRKSHIFLPLVWMWRICRSTIRIRKIRQKQDERNAWQTEENKNAYRAHLEAVGLDIMNGRGTP